MTQDAKTRRAGSLTFTWNQVLSIICKVLLQMPNNAIEHLAKERNRLQFTGTATDGWVTTWKGAHHHLNAN